MVLQESEPLARYLYQKSHYNASTSKVKHHAFMPPKDMRLSVFRTQGLAEAEVWALGDTLRAESPIARGVIVVQSVLKCGLKVDPDDHPPRHASVIGWPDDRASILEKAVSLSRAAELRLRQNQ